MQVKNKNHLQCRGHHSVGKSIWEKSGSFLSSQYVLLLTQVSSFDFLWRQKKSMTAMKTVKENNLFMRQAAIIVTNYKQHLETKTCSLYHQWLSMWGTTLTWRILVDVLGCSLPALSACLSATAQSSVFAPLQPPGSPPPAACQHDTDTFIMQILSDIHFQNLIFTKCFFFF